LHDRFAPKTPGGDANVPLPEEREKTLDVGRVNEPAGTVEPGAAGGENGSPDYPPDLVFIVGPDGTILFVNRELPGVPQGEVLGTSIYEYIFPEQHDLVRQCLDRVFATGEAGGYECSGMRPHDAHSWYQCRVAPNHREARVVSATIIARDITSLKVVEDRLRQEREELKDHLEEQATELTEMKRAWAERMAREGERDRDLGRFRELLDQSGEAIFVTDPSTGQFIDANNTACRWLGRSRDELLSLTIHDLEVDFPLQTPETTAEHVVDTRDSSRPRTFDHGFHRRRDGTTFPVEVAIAHRWLGDTEYVLAVAREINSRKRTEAALREAEDHYRALFTLAHDAVYLSARDGTVAEANDAAVALFGYPRETLIGAPAKQLYHRPADIRRFQRAVAENGSARDLPVDMVRRDGSTFRALLSATLRRSGDGTLLGYQCVLRPARDGATVSYEVSLPEVETTRAPQPTAAPVTTEEPHNEVLLLDPDPASRSEAREILERAGISVIEAANEVECQRAVQTLEAGIGAILVARQVLEFGWECYQELRKRRPSAQLLVIADEPEAAESQLSGLSGVQPVSRHPLALVQRVRSVLRAETPT
jgi:PAS domain S-box-containing protein